MSVRSISPESNQGSVPIRNLTLSQVKANVTFEAFMKGTVDRAAGHIEVLLGRSKRWIPITIAIPDAPPSNYNEDTILTCVGVSLYNKGMYGGELVERSLTWEEARYRPRITGYPARGAPKSVFVDSMRKMVSELSGAPATYPMKKEMIITLSSLLEVENFWTPRFLDSLQNLLFKMSKNIRNQTTPFIRDAWRVAVYSGQSLPLTKESLKERFRTHDFYKHCMSNSASRVVEVETFTGNEDVSGMLIEIEDRSLATILRDYPDEDALYARALAGGYSKLAQFHGVDTLPAAITWVVSQVTARLDEIRGSRENVRLSEAKATRLELAVQNLTNTETLLRAQVTELTDRLALSEARLAATRVNVPWYARVWRKASTLWSWRPWGSDNTQTT
jgi:hypothetical protein